MKVTLATVNIIYLVFQKKSVVSDPEQPTQSLKRTNLKVSSRFQNRLQSYNNQNNVVLAYRSMDRIVSPEINLYIDGQLVSDSGVETIQWGRNSLFIKWCWVK